MRKRQFSKSLTVLFLSCLLGLVMFIPVSADMGPQALGAHHL